MCEDWVINIEERFVLVHLNSGVRPFSLFCWLVYAYLYKHKAQSVGLSIFKLEYLKTLLALAAALEMVVERNMYDKIIVTRSTPEIAESIGFLPGTEEEKMLPWLAAITDSLEVLHKHDENTKGSMNYIMEKANIQYKSVNFMRGRSIQNAIVILDESQNLTASQLKTIITRCGEGTKLIVGGNLAQIDSNYLSAVTSGLTYLVEKFKDFSGSATINLDGVVRSRLASFAEENL